MESNPTVQYKDYSKNREKSKNKNQEIVLSFRNNEIELAFVDVAPGSVGEQEEAAKR